MHLIINIHKGEEFFIATIEKFPAVITQGKTIEEAKQNVADALKLYMEDSAAEVTEFS